MYIESLETRMLLAYVPPTNDEQLLIELTNRARANPGAEAALLGIDLNEGLTPGTIANTARQPLAPSAYLVDAAGQHSQWMLDNDVFSHTGAGGTSSSQRMTNAGYTFGGSYGSGENIAWQGSGGTTPNPTTLTATLHRNLFVDEGVAGRGHRLNILNSSFREIGTGVRSGVFSTSNHDYNAVMAVEDFAYVNPGAIITGVAYSNNLANDNFYTSGEGLGGILVTATRVSDAVQYKVGTFNSGGYALKVPDGTYSLTASGGPLASNITFSNVVVSGLNVKRDFVPVGADTLPPARWASAKAINAVVSPAYKFTVTYSDVSAVAAGTLGNYDVHVTGKNNFKALAKFVSRSHNANVNTISVVYRITAPGGSWSAADNGTYSIVMRPAQVSDGKGQFLLGGKIGSFSVQIPSAAPVPQAAPTPVKLFSDAPVDGEDVWG